MLPHRQKELFLQRERSQQQSRTTFKQRTTYLMIHLTVPYPRFFLALSAICCQKPPSEISKKLQFLIPFKKRLLLKIFKIPDEESQKKFGGPVSNEKHPEV